MDRRTYASTLIAATAGLAGCATLETESRSSTVAADDRVTLRAVRVKNHSDRESKVNVTVVRNGSNQFWSQLDVPADGQRTPNTNWPTSGESFVVVCQCSTYTSTEIASMEHENNDRGVPYEMLFVIEEAGDIEQRLLTVEGI